MRAFIRSLVSFILSHKRECATIAGVVLFSFVFPPALKLLAFMGEIAPDPGATPPTPPEGGKLGETPPGNPSPQATDENIKALQRKLSEKDRVLKDLEAEVARLRIPADDSTTKLITEMQQQVAVLTEQLTQSNREKRHKELSEKYPDMLADLLIDRTDEQIEKLVEASRAKAREVFGDSKYFTQPTYRDAAAVDAEIEVIKKDSKISGEQKALRVLELQRVKNLFRK
jgi:hypothetical protein